MAIIVSSEDKILKLSVLGLHNAGKSSIIMSLKHEFDTFAELQPTKGVDRRIFEIFGQTLVFWDYGGQEHYRQEYIQYENKYFSNIQHLFYVVDIQDSENLNESIQYFTRCVEIAKRRNPGVSTHILFHKWDPPVNRGLDYEEFEKNKQKFLDEALMHVPEDKPACIFETTIYEPLSVVKAISKPLFQARDLHDKTSMLIRSFCKKNGYDFAFVKTKQMFELGQYVSPDLHPLDVSDDVSDFLKENFETIFEKPYFQRMYYQFSLFSTRFIIKGSQGIFLVILVAGIKPRERIDDANHQKIILDAKSELKKLYNGIGLGNYRIAH